MANLNAENIATSIPMATGLNLVTCDIAQLEGLFAVSRENLDALRDLEDELRYRQSPQALVLLNRIQNALDANARGSSQARSGVNSGSDRSAGCAI